MKIERVAPQVAVQAYAPVKRAQRVQGTFAQGKDQVDISENAMFSAAMIQRVKQSLAEPTQEQKRHLAQVSAKVQSGEYSVDAADVARRMLSGVYFDEMV